MLAVVFAVAAVGKLVDPAGSRTAVAGFGVPETITGPVVSLLPLVELTAAALLIPSATGRAGSELSLLLMPAFSCTIAPGARTADT